MSDTPRTELMVERAPIGLRTNVAFEQSCDLCRQLERELNEANKTISLQHELMTTAEKRGVDKAKEELNEANDRIKRLEREIELFREHADYGDVCLVEAILKGEEIGRKENQDQQ